MRIGTGMDAHRFVPDRKLLLGGVEVEYEKGLAGHSDADVVLHALMDALLGASGGDDIGEMFPDTDPAYLDASSMDLLESVIDVVRGRGYRASNVDLAVICEEPRIGPYRERIRERIATALGIEADQVSIKGTTTEGMGFTGRREGIACIAVVLLAGDTESGGEEGSRKV